MTDPPIRPSDPDAFRRQVYRRAATLRRRRMVTAMTSTAAAVTVAGALLFSSFSPLAAPPGTQLAIGSYADSTSVTSTQQSGSSRPASSSTLTPSGAGSTTTTNGYPTTSSPDSTPGATRTSTTSSSQTSMPTTTTTPTVPTTSTLPSTTTLPTTVTTTTTTTTTSPSPPPPHDAIVPAGCGEPPAAAASAAAASLREDLVGTWIQCKGPSIFGPSRGGALVMLANGTWQRLRRTPGGWLPLHGPNDSGVWEVIAPATAASVTAVLVHFIAVPSPDATSSRAPLTSLAPPASSRSTALVAAGTSITATTATAAADAPRQWTVAVMLTAPPNDRAQFVEGTIVANYRHLMPSATGGPIRSS